MSPAKTPSDRLIGRSIKAIRSINADSLLVRQYPAFRGASIIELDDGSLIVASREHEPHACSELMLVEPDGEQWSTLWAK